MTIQFRDITDENWLECIFLTTNKDGTPTVCEEYVASNVLSIAQSKVQKGWVTKAIYDEEKMVGFAMYGFCEEQSYRGNRYSEKLIKYALEQAKLKGYEQVYLATNHIGLYEKFGFEYVEDKIDVFNEVCRVYLRSIKMPHI